MQQKFDNDGIQIIDLEEKTCERSFEKIKMLYKWEVFLSSYFSLRNLMNVFILKQIMEDCNADYGKFGMSDSNIVIKPGPKASWVWFAFLNQMIFFSLKFVNFSGLSRIFIFLLFCLLLTVCIGLLIPSFLNISFNLLMNLSFNLFNKHSWSAYVCQSTMLCAKGQSEFRARRVGLCVGGIHGWIEKSI